MFNSLAPGKFEWNFRHVIFKQILVELDKAFVRLEKADIGEQMSEAEMTLSWNKESNSNERTVDVGLNLSQFSSLGWRN